MLSPNSHVAACEPRCENRGVCVNHTCHCAIGWTGDRCREGMCILCMCMYVYMLCKYECMYVHMCICTCVCMHVCMRVCMYVCMYISEFSIFLQLFVCPMDVQMEDTVYALAIVPVQQAGREQDATRVK